MKTVYLLLGLGLTSWLQGAGCSTPEAPKFLFDYDRLGKGRFLEGYFADADRIAEGGYTRVLLGSISTDAIRDREQLSVFEAVGWLQGSVLRAAPAGGEPVILALPRPGAAAQLHLAITEMDPGSAGTGVLAFLLGGERIRVQVEGRVLDLRNRHTLATFSEGRSSPRDLARGDLGGRSGRALVREAIEEIGADIRRELAASFGLP